MDPRAPAEPPTQFYSLLALIWLAGMAMRLPVLAIPPILPNIRLELGMSETQVGALMGLPVALFALFAVPGSLLIARLGVATTLIVGLTVTTFASAARGLAVDVVSLYAASIVVGLGIAIMQPTVAPLLSGALQKKMGLGTAVFGNGNLIGSTLAAAMTIPVILPLVDGSWRMALVLWSIPIALTALLFAVFARRLGATAGRPAVAARWWPDWKSRQTWLLGLTFGSNNAIFFGINAFVPDYLTSQGRADLITEALTGINLAQLTVTFVMIAVAEHMYKKPWPFVVFGFTAGLGLIGIVTTSGLWLVASIALTGGSTAVTFVMLMALPPALSAPGDAHRTAAGMFTISYACALIVPVIAGAVWDLTGVPVAVFAPIAFCAVTLSVLGVILTRDAARSTTTTPAPG
jgi:CP family cyanate transporter-like MFS transporter